MNFGYSKRVIVLVLGLGHWLAGLPSTQAAEVWSGLGEGVDNNVFALAHDGTNLYAGGQFLASGGTSMLHIAMWNGESWVALGDGIDNDVSALAHDGTRLYAGGLFSTAGGTPASLVATWDGSSWSELGGGLVGYRVYSLLQHGSRLYVAGDFTNAGGVAVNNVAMWDGTNWSSLGSGIIGGYGANSLAHDGVNLYVGGGYLTNAGGMAINGLAKWNGTSWTNLGDGIVGYVSSLAHDGANLYAAGWFTEAGGVAATNIAKWNGSSWSPVGDGLDGMVSALLNDGPYLYAGGSIGGSGGVSLTNIAVWDGSAWSSFGGFGGGVNALTLIGTNMVAGGYFTEADGNSANRVAEREALPTYAAITLSQTSLNLRSSYSRDARTGYVVMSNAGNVAFAYQCAIHEPGPAFLSWTPTNGTLAAGASLICAVQVSSASLDVGTYYATNVITAPLATNSPLSVSVRLDVLKGYDPIYFSNTNQAYDGTPKSVTATSLHANVVLLTYNGSTNPPAELGAYAVTGVVDTANWNTTNRATLTIAKMPQAIVNFLPPADSLFLTNDIAHLSADGGGSGNPVVFSLVPGGVGILSSGTNLSFSGPGVVTVYANQAGNAFYDDAPTVAYTFYIYPNIAYVATSGDNANNGRTWATAKRTIQAGVDIGRPGGAVWVSNGVYNTGGGVAMGGATNRVAITNSIAVRSVNGPLFTTIAGGDQIRPVGIETGLLAGFTLTNGVVTNAWGGGAWCMGPEAVITNCHINGNQAVSGGGVSGGTVYNCDLLGNYSADSGGGAIVSRLVRCNISGNRAQRNGGGVRWSEVSLCVIYNNLAIWNTGGGVNESSASGCLIVGNVSVGAFAVGGAVYATLENCTVYGNAPAGVAAGTIHNSIVWGNGQELSNWESPTIRNSCVGGIRSGVDGNLSTDPLFVDAANGDFRLQAASPCINAGDNALVPSNLVADLAGRPRISGGRVDMGAHELTLNEYYVAKNGQTPVLPYGAWTNAATNIESAVLASGSKNDRVFHFGQGSYTTPTAIQADNVSGNGDPGHLTLMPTGVVVSSGLSLVGSNQSYVAFRGTRADTQVVNRIALQQVKSSLMARAAKRPMVAGFTYTLAFKTDGSVVGWGRNDYGQTQVPGGSRFIAIAAGLDASAGLDAGGSIVFWGNGTELLPLPSPNTGFVDVFGGPNALHLVGLKADGSLVAWGDNKFGQCAVPAPNAGYMAAAAGGDHSLGLKAGGTVVAWGLNSYGQCSVPTPNSGFVAVAAGALHSLGLKSDGSVVAWGNDADGQCMVPAPNSGFIAVSAGSYFSMGLKSDGAIVTWGKNDRNQCNVPAPNTNFVALAAGQDHAVGLKSDGSIVVWGYSANGAHAVPGPNNSYGVTAWPEQLGLLVDGCRVIATNSVTLTTSQAETDLSRNAPVLTVQNCGQLITPSLMNKLPLRILNNGLLAWQGVGWWTNSTRRAATDDAPAAPDGGIWARGYVFMDEGSLSAGASNAPGGGAAHRMDITNKMALASGTTFGALAGMVGGDITVQGDATGTVMTAVSSVADEGGSNWTASVTARVENAVIAGGATLNLRQGVVFQGGATFNADIVENATITEGTNGTKATLLTFDPLTVSAGSRVTVGTASGPVVVDLAQAMALQGTLRDTVSNLGGTNLHVQQYAFAVTNGGEGLSVHFDGFKLISGAGMTVTSMTMDVETDLNTGLYQSLARFYLSDGSVIEVYRATSGQVLPTLTPGPGGGVSLDLVEREGVYYVTAGNKTEQGTPWDWLRGYGFTNAFETADQADPDGDRVATSHEYVMNTDPTNGLAFLSITDMGQIGDAISWMGMTGRVYDVQYSTNVLDWATVSGASNLPGTGSALIFTNSSVDSSPLNYRLRVRVAE